jgi:hypothetical protein
MRAGQLAAPLPSLEESRTRLQQELARLPGTLTDLDAVAAPRPAIAPSLVRLAAAIDART